MKKILIIKLGAIGDVLRTTAVLAGLKEKYSPCSIYWVTKPEAAPLLKNNPHIDNVIIVSKDLKDELKVQFDLVVSMDDENSACELASAVKAKEIVGAYLKDGNRVYTESSAAWFDMGLISKFGKKKADELKLKNIHTYQELLYKILNLEYDKQEPILVLSPKEHEFGKKFASQHRISHSDTVIGINSGAGGRWEDKKLSIGQAAELIVKIKKTFPHAKIILFGGPEEKERNQKIKELAKEEIIDGGCDNSLMEFSSLINLCGLIVTSDSLAMHIAIALCKKVIAFFYPTSANEIELYGRGTKIIWEGKSYCSYQAKCDFKPVINTDKIIQAIKGLL
jgi:heptosyltransferase II